MSMDEKQMMMALYKIKSKIWNYKINIISSTADPSNIDKVHSA